ncbi:MAG: hypothetical protein ACPGO5_03940 [Patescibacteria group bacterium]
MRLQKQTIFIFTLILGIALFHNLGFFVALFSNSYEQFTGMIGLSRGDKTVYLSMIEQVKQGSFLVQNLFTKEVSSGLFHPLWIVLGFVAKIFSLQAKTIFHASSFVFGVGLLWYLFSISKHLFVTHKQRILFLCGLGFLGGLGRMSLLFYNPELFAGDAFFEVLPVDLWYSEAFSYLTLHHSPLFILSQGLMIGAWWLLIQKNVTTKQSFLAATLLLVLGFIHPFDFVPWWVVMMVFSILVLNTKTTTFKSLLKTLLPSIISSGIVTTYYILLLQNNPSIAAWNEQNIMLPPSMFSLLVGYGLMWPLAFLGIHYSKKFVQKRVWYFLISWFLTIPFLMYAPIHVSRRLVSSFGIIMALLSVYGLLFWWERYGKQVWQRGISSVFHMAASLVFVLLLIFGPLYQIIDSTNLVLHREFPGYISGEQFVITQLLKEAPADSIVVAEPFLANTIPGTAGLRVWLGHDVQTVDFEHRLAQLQRLYIIEWSEWHDEFIQNEKVSHIVWPTENNDRIPDTWNEIFRGEQLTLWGVGY